MIEGKKSEEMDEEMEERMEEKEKTMKRGGPKTQQNFNELDWIIGWFTSKVAKKENWTCPLDHAFYLFDISEWTTCLATAIQIQIQIIWDHGKGK